MIPQRDLRIVYPADPRWAGRPTLREIARASRTYHDGGDPRVILALFGIESEAAPGAPPDAGGHLLPTGA